MSGLWRNLPVFLRRNRQLMEPAAGSVNKPKLLRLSTPRNWRATTKDVDALDKA
jgi:hypothetical protein